MAIWKSWKFLLVLAAICGVVALFVFGFTTNPKLVKSPLIGKPAPNFTLTRLGGTEKLALRELRGTPVLLNFWASWCVACREEAPLLQATYLRHDKGAGEIKVIGIAIQDEEAKALAFAKRFGKTYFLALDDPTGTISLNYGLYGVPETFFIDREGTIAYKHVGAITHQVVEEQVAKLTAQ